MSGERFDGYRVVLASFVVQGVTIGSMFAYGVFFPALEAEFGWSRTTISGASSLAFVVMGVLGIAAGRLNDVIGPRVLITASALFFGIGQAAGPSAAGAVADVAGSFAPAFWLAAGVALLGALSSLLLRHAGLSGGARRLPNLAQNQR